MPVDVSVMPVVLLSSPVTESLVSGGGGGSQPSGKQGSSHVVDDDSELVVPGDVSLVSGGGGGSQPSGKQGSSHVVELVPDCEPLPLVSLSPAFGPHAAGAAVVTAAPAIDAARIILRKWACTRSRGERWFGLDIVEDLRRGVIDGHGALQRRRIQTATRGVVTRRGEHLGAQSQPLLLDLAFERA